MNEQDDYPSLRWYVDAMRALGISRVEFGAISGASLPLFGRGALTVIQLSDTIPAPPPEDFAEPPTQPEELKAGNQCRATGCAETGGWMGTTLCRAHGLAQAGVKS